MDYVINTHMSMYATTDAVTNEVLEPITFVLAYPTVYFFFQQLTIQRRISYMFRHTATILNKFKLQACVTSQTFTTNGQIRNVSQKRYRLHMKP